MAQWIDWFLGLLAPAQWEAWRNWVATLGGLLALTIAALTYARNVRIKREEQARLVYVKVKSAEVHRVGETYRFEGGRPLVIVQPNGFMAAMDRAATMMSNSDPQVTARIAIRNGSKELIAGVYVEIGEPSTATPFPIGHFVDIVEPESEYLLDFDFPVAEQYGLPELHPRIEFRDSSNVWWYREGSLPVKRRPPVLAKGRAEREAKAERELEQWALGE